MNLTTELLLIPLFPFIAFAIQVFFGRKLPRQGDWVSTLAIFISFLISLKVFVQVIGAFDPGTMFNSDFVWMSMPDHDITVGVMADNMTAVMLLMVSMCAFLIHLFSTWYMHGEVRYSRFFAYLSLFTGSMLGLVVSDNLLTLFIFWELMGFCSYSLIGFYFERDSAVKANLKAFMTTRVGDTCLFVGMMIIWMQVGSLQFSEIYSAIGDGAFSGELFGIGLASLAGFLVFLGTVGKSAQVPLQVWLPDAMEGPTPVSALIHAATMVAAGVYLILRTFPLLEVGGVLPIVAYIGAITAFLAATIAIIQTDLKKVLAYSTISQLGYMVLGVGVGAYYAAFMHLITHALFKACLFMSSGSVIHGIHTQDMMEMGGLRKKMPYTFTAMLIATCAIAGYPFTSGFVSKDKILAQTLYFGGLTEPQHFLLPLLGFLAAGMTAFYMFRLMFLTFFGEPRDKEKYDHTHQEHKGEVTRWLPLLWLAALSFSVFFSGSLTGAFEADKILGSFNDWFEKLMVPVVATGNQSLAFAKKFDEHTYHTAHLSALGLSVFMAAVGTLLAAIFYYWKKLDASKVQARLSGLHYVISNLYFFDWFYIQILIKKIYMPIAQAIAWFDAEIYDRYLIDGWTKVLEVFYRVSRRFDDKGVDGFLVDGTAKAFSTFGIAFRVIQTGRVQNYLAMGIGLVAIISVYFAFR
jgi:NADH-quinone oxidoreductase subunit L